MSVFLLLFFVISKLSVIICKFDPSKINYCKVTCGEKHYPHAGCKCENFPSLGQIEFVKNQVEFRRNIVDYLNEKRNAMASLKSGNTSLPSAADMMVINYDLELEYIARCQQKHYAKNVDEKKECLITLAGQSFFTESYHSGDKLALGLETKILDENFNTYIEKLLNKSFRHKIGILGNKSVKWFESFPMIWPSINNVGCARFISSNNFTLRCNYRGDNLRSVYKIGKACSACPGNTKCNPNKWKFLCGIEQPVVELFQKSETDKSNSIKNEYCGKKCNNEEHGACGCEQSADTNYENLENMAKFRKKIVDFHNKVRNQVASGYEEIEYSIGPEEDEDRVLPPAGNMLMINYDLDLEFLARCFCRHFNDSKSNKCWTTLDGKKLLKLYSKKPERGQEPYGYIDDIKEYFESRYKKGINRLNNDTIQSCKEDVTDENDEFAYLFEQYHTTIKMIWSSANRIGCAHCWDYKTRDDIFVCFYNGEDGLGKLTGKPIYEIGESCSACPRKTSCNQNNYSSLCGEQKAIPTTVVDLPEHTDNDDDDDDNNNDNKHGNNNKYFDYSSVGNEKTRSDFITSLVVILLHLFCRI